MSNVHDDRSEIRGVVRGFILTEFLSDEDPASLTDETPLISGGILDSIANARLVSFLEGRYNVRFKAFEVGPDRLDNINRIVETVEKKMRG